MLALLNPELVSFLDDWLKEERLRMLPQLKIKDNYLRLDGNPISENPIYGLPIAKGVSMKVVSEWLKSKKQ